MREDEYILCAAIRRKSPRTCKPYHKGTNDICDIEIGYRHHDIFQRFGPDVLDGSQQGFYTSKGRYVDREEAMAIAKKAHQTDSDKTQLYSEDLY